MTVKELAKFLEKMPQDSEVVFEDSNRIQLPLTVVGEYPLNKPLRLVAKDNMPRSYRLMCHNKVGI